MDLEELNELVIPIVFILAVAWVTVRLLAPFAEALARRLAMPPTETDDAMREEMERLAGRVAAHEGGSHLPAAVEREPLEQHVETR